MRALLDEEKLKDKHSSSDDDDSCTDFSKLHLKASKLKDKHKGKLFDQLLGFPVNSQLDLKLVQGIFGVRAEQRAQEGNRQLLQQHQSGISLESMPHT